jgi:hypothetical protein
MGEGHARQAIPDSSEGEIGVEREDEVLVIVENDRQCMAGDFMG